MDQFTRGAIAMACLIAGLFFLRFWRRTGDRLFIIFASAFWLLGLTRLAVGLTINQSEDRILIYSIRLIAYLLILAAIVDKNRNEAPPQGGLVE
ncbi:MAG: DUF5985 family protein [Planctomycetia bacterium]|nr:DUF5985 family protein [Planctomycetia bacterium]